MNISLREIVIRDLVKNYTDNQEEGVFGYDGKLNIRPPYQREFIYKDKQRDSVIDTVNKGFPLNTMYWVENEDGTFELLDGQQRTISLCQYVNGDFSLDGMYFHNLLDEDQNRILDYKLMVYVCKGTDKERLEWFRTINISGERLTDQELLNINYIGPWLSDAKRKFSKTGCVAYKMASKYIKGSPIRQEYLETVLRWISEDSVVEYMSKHQHDSTATELWSYFQNVISWVQDMFPNYRKEMLGLNWGRLYNKYHTNPYEPQFLEKEVKSLMENDEVTDKKGIYEYVLGGCDENLARKLSKRTFSNNEKREAYEKQNGVCPICGNRYSYEEMQGDHIVPWWRGGKTLRENLQMICIKCNSGKSGKMVQ